MTPSSSFFILAQGEGCTGVAVAFVVITIIGWILQLVGGSKQAQQRGAKPVRPRPRDDRLQREIDLFLEDVDDRRRPPDHAAQRQPAGPSILEVVPEESPERGRRIASQRRSGSPPAAPREPAAAPRPAASVRPADEGRQPRREAAEIPRHLVQESDYLTPLAALGGAEHLDPFIGGGGGLGSSGEGGAGGIHPLVALVRNHHGMKQAIVMSEILGSPLARRPRAADG